LICFSTGVPAKNDLVAPTTSIAAVLNVQPRLAAAHT
jgi:hypothetical protein